MIGRRALITGLGAQAVLAQRATAQAFRPRDGRERFRIGLLVFGSGDSLPGGPLFEALRRGLEEFGYREGQNVEFIVRGHDVKDYAGLAAKAQELVDSAPDLILSPTTPTANALRAVTRTIPIVMVAVADPAGSGLIASLANPGGNITGLSNNTLGLLSKHVSLLKELKQETTRIGFLLGTFNPLHEQWSKIIQEVATQIGFDAFTIPFSADDDLETIFDQPASDRQIGSVAVIADAFAYLHRERISKAALRSKLPTISAYREGATAGGLLAYGADIPDLYRRAAGYIDRILRGDRPANMPVEYPIRYNL